ncbi:MAG: alginate O-acetyltransferase AlgF [Pseudomonadota bacterium]
MSRPSTLLLGAALLTLFSTAHADQPMLYPTGPAEDASFVRFVDGLDTPLSVIASKDARIELTPAASSTTWMPVKARSPLGATLQQGGQGKKIEVSVQPSEFVTVAAVYEGASGWRTETARETPTDFSAHKVSLGLMNLASECASASVKVAGREIAIVEDVAPRAIKRRQINPVALSVELYCQGTKTGEPADLGSLRAGERWTLMVRPTATGARLQPILDRMP